MSANNFLKISVCPKHKLQDDIELFLVEDCDMEHYDGGVLVGESPTLLGAIKIANDYMKDNDVEYGIHVDVDVD